MAEILDYKIVPLVDDGAAHNSIGEIELGMLQNLNPSEDYELETKPLDLNQ